MTEQKKTADLLTHWNNRDFFCVIVKTLPLRYRPGPDDIWGSALARCGVLFLLRPLSATSPGASLPPSTGAHFLLEALLTGRRPQQLWLMWLCAAEQTTSASALWGHRETPAATMWFSTEASRGHQTPYNSCKRLHSSNSGKQRWSWCTDVILGCHLGQVAKNPVRSQRLFSHINMPCFSQVSIVPLQFKTEFLHPVVVLIQEAPTHLFPTFIVEMAWVHRGPATFHITVYCQRTVVSNLLSVVFSFKES